MKLKNFIIILLILAFSSSCYAVNIEIPWVDSSNLDLIGYDSGLRLRKEDIPADFDGVSLDDFGNSATTYENAITGAADDDVPEGVEVQHSRKNVRSESTFAWYTPGAMVFPNAPKCKPTTQDFWFKTPYHEAYSGVDYVFQAYISHLMPGRQAPVEHIYFCPVVGIGMDVHDYAPGTTCIYNPDGVDGVGNDTEVALGNNTWTKYTIDYDWDNQEIDVAIQDETALEGISFLNHGTYFGQSFTGLYSYSNGLNQTGTRDHISYYREKADRTISMTDASFTDEPFTYWAVTNFARFFMSHGTATQSYDISEHATENVNSIKLTIYEDVVEDATIGMTYGRSLCHDDSSRASAATGTASNACDGSDTTYWQPTGENTKWIYHHDRARTVKEITIFADGTAQPTTFAVYGSADGTNWSEALYSGTYTPVAPVRLGTINEYDGMTFLIETPASYEYLSIEFADANIKILNIQLREAASLYTTSAAASSLFESRVSTNSGSTWSDWATITSGNNIAGIAANTTYSTLQVEVRTTLDTENPQFQPRVTGLKLDVYGVSSAETPHKTLLSGIEGDDPVVNGACGTSDGQTFSSTPTTNLCTAGTAGEVTLESTTYSWDCTGSGGGTTDNCTATYEAPADSTAPETTITTSSPQTIITNSLTVTGTATDAVGVAGCKSRHDSEPTSSAGTACTGTTEWSCPTNGYVEGANTLYVECYDAAGNYDSGNSIVVNYAPLRTMLGVTISGGTLQ